MKTELAPLIPTRPRSPYWSDANAHAQDVRNRLSRKLRRDRASELVKGIAVYVIITGHAPQIAHSETEELRHRATVRPQARIVSLDVDDL